MKLMIRFADKVVGGFIILALGILVFVVFMLGSQQRWFSRDYSFIAHFSSAAGISSNMAVQHRGFTIGHVRSIRLTENDKVEVVFTIFDTFIDRARTGSLVEVLTSPIGVGGGFIFHPGMGGELLNEWDIVPSVQSEEGKRLIAEGLARLPENDDGIINIVNQVGTLLAALNSAFIYADENTSLGRTVGNLEGTLAGARQILEDVPDRLMAQLEPILADINALSRQAADPDGAIMAVLDGEGEVYAALVASLESIAGTLRSLERTAEFIPPQLPQLGEIITELHNVIQSAEDVLVALTNNPLLRRGVPERRETPVGGTRPRDIEF